MTSEDSMRDRISAELDAQRPPLGDLVGQAVVEGRRRKRRARLGVYTMSAAGVLVVASAVVQFAPSTSRGAPPSAGAATLSPRPAVSTPTADATRPTVTVAPVVKQVAPGTIMLEQGIYLNYTTDSMSWWQYHGGLTSRYNGTNTWNSDFVAFSSTGRLITGFYVGGDDVAAATVTVDGEQYSAVVTKVTGSRGWCGLYYLRPPGAPLWHTARIDVYDSSGRILATSSAGGFAPPATAHPSHPAHTGNPPVTAVPIDTPFPGATAMAPTGANADGSEPGKH